MIKILTKISAIFIMICFVLVGIDVISVNASALSENIDTAIPNVETIEKEIDDNYIPPALSDVVYSLDDNSNDTSDLQYSILSSSTKDQYEDNNSFQDATLLFSNSAGAPGSNSYTRNATLHREP